MYCPKCGKENNSNAKFCCICGTKINKKDDNNNLNISTNVNLSSNTDTIINSANNIDLIFTNNIINSQYNNTSIQTNSSNISNNISTNSNVKQKKSKKKHKKFLITILLLALISGGVYYYFSNIDTRKDKILPKMALTETGIPKFIDGKFTNRKVKSAMKIIFEDEKKPEVKIPNKSISFIIGLIGSIVFTLVSS